MSNFESYINKVQSNFAQLQDQNLVIGTALDILIKSASSRNKFMFCGNGGSAADSQHLAAEMVGRFILERTPFPAMALSTNSSSITAIGNDYGYDLVFHRQIEAFGQQDDVLIALSTSGNSRNVCLAAKRAQEMGIKVIGLTGSKGGDLADFCDVVIKVPSDETCHIQEMHIAIGHYLCMKVEEKL
jgi:D-sedoheptulose 7-phosphate isomerase